MVMKEELVHDQIMTSQRIPLFLAADVLDSRAVVDIMQCMLNKYVSHDGAATLLTTCPSKKHMLNTQPSTFTKVTYHRPVLLWVPCNPCCTSTMQSLLHEHHANPAA